MSLNIDLRVNSEFPFAHIEAKRIFGGSDPDDLNNYQVEVVELLDGRVLNRDYIIVENHRYGDGGLKLLKKIMENLDDGTI